MPEVVRFCARTRAYPGEFECGDSYLVRTGKAGTLIALADGLGHGPSAAQASRAFCDFVEKRVDDPLDQLMVDASAALHTTRGAAVALVRISPGAGVLSYCGVGNIDMQAASRGPVRPVSLPGIVGRRIRTTRTFEYAIHKGDLFALHSDGISSRLDFERYRHLDIEEVADAMVRDHGKQTDDVGVVVFKI